MSITIVHPRCGRWLSTWADQLSPWGVLLAFRALGCWSMGRDIANAGSTFSSIARGFDRVPGGGGRGVVLVGDTMMQCVFYGGFRLTASRAPVACAARGIPHGLPV